MKESISYSFLLNIIILFIFVCAAIITGIFSYYRAFRAGTIIINEIEKFEGFNCVSAESISKKLGGVSYNLPFEVKCKDGETNCITDEGKNYKVYSYNIDAESSSKSVEKIYIGHDGYDGASSVTCDNNICKMSSKYQYGVYTYMYIDLPVVSSLVRIPIYNKTRIMYDQRNLYSQENDDSVYVFDVDSIPLRYIDGYSKNKYSFDYINALMSYAKIININYSEYMSGHEIYNDEVKKYGYGIRDDNEYLNPNYNIRELFRLSDKVNRNGQSLIKTGKKECGTVVDWSLF